MGVVAVAFVAAALWLPAVPSYLIAVVASQLLSPILWDHYALILLLPVAWLIERGWTWAALIPLATCILLIGFVPPVTYPIAFGVTLFALLAAGFQDRGRAEPRLRLRRRPARDRYPCGRSRGPDARRRTRGVHGSSPLPGRLGRDPARDRLVLRLLAVEPRVRRRSRRPVLPRRRLPPRPGVARLSLLGAVRHHLRSSGRVYVPFAPFPAIVLMPLVALVGAVTADQWETGSTRSSPRSGVVLAWWVSGRIGATKLRDRFALAVLLGFSTQIWWVTTRGGVWHTGHLIATILTLLLLAEMFGGSGRS